MQGSEKNNRVGKHVAAVTKPDPSATEKILRDESNVYGDEADIPVRRKKKTPAAKKKASTKNKKNRARKTPFSNLAVKKKKSVYKKRKSRRTLFEIMSATGNDSFFKPLRIFGHEIRFWPLFLLALIVFMAVGVMLNNSNLTVAEQKITVVGLPEDLEGYRILVLSDLNGRRFGDEQSLLLRTINNEGYDAIFCLGDMVGKDGDPEPFYEFLEGLRYPERVYFICGDSDPGPFVETVRDITGTLSQWVLEDWILGAIERGANYVDGPTCIQVKNANLWISPATMLNLETTETLETWKSQTEQEEDGVISGLSEDRATLPITSYRYQMAQKLYDGQRNMASTDIHIALSHEAPSDEFIYTSEDHGEDERYLSAPDLILAGHYCGGVWRLPFIGAFYVPDNTMERHGWFPDQEDVSGLSTVGETQVYITAGLSTNSDVPLMPFRLLNSPQISLLTLTSTLPENMLEVG